ncbi:MAG: hypothetical protein KUL79_13905 [Thauera sp.]|nr:hypothetical protein [Thauera sp.]
MPARPLRRLILIACSALLLAGCGLRFAYSQLDWLLPWYLRDYITLNAGQRVELDARLAGLLDWHCRSHLPEYVALLRSANATLADGRVDAARLEPFLARGEALWREIVAELESELRVLLAGLSAEQVDELAASFGRRGEEARAEFLSGDAAAQHAARIERMEERLRRWFGRMTPAQRDRIAAWSRALQPTTEAWLDDRARWQAELLDALRVRADASAFAPRLAQALAPREARWSAQHRAAVAHNRARTLELLADLHALAGEAQRRRLQGEIEALASQFAGMACTEPARVSVAGGR